MDPRIPHRVVFVDSRNGEGTESDFQIEFSNLDRRFNRLVVLSVNIPKTYYAVEGTLTATIEGTDYQMAFEGNYSFRSFGSALETALNALGTGVTFTVTRSTLRLNYTIAATGNTTSVTISSSDIRRPLGFQVGLCCLEIPPDSSVTTGVVQFTIDTILVKSNTTNSSQAHQANILASVPDINTVFGSSIHYEVHDAIFASRPFKPEETIMRFFLQDTDGNPVRLNTHWTMELCFFKSSQG